MQEASRDSLINQLQVEEIQPSVEIESEGRLLICSYPKTGRTWVRFMLAQSLAKHYGLGVELDLTNAYTIVANDNIGLLPDQPVFGYEGIIPKIEMSHSPYSSGVHDKTNIIFLTRDPRDILVSHWLHCRNQVHSFSGDLTEFVHHPDLGINAFLSHLTGWAPNLNEEQIITYESMRVDPAAALEKVITSFKLPISEAEIDYAVEASSIDRMREKEIARGIVGHDYDRSDPDALRVRRGRVGGYVDYLQHEDEVFIHEWILASSPQAKSVISLTGYPVAQIQ